MLPSSGVQSFNALSLVYTILYKHLLHVFSVCVWCPMYILASTCFQYFEHVTSASGSFHAACYAQHRRRGAVLVSCNRHTLPWLGTRGIVCKIGMQRCVKNCQMVNRQYISSIHMYRQSASISLSCRCCPVRCKAHKGKTLHGQVFDRGHYLWGS